MMKCVHCAKEIPDDVVFCKFCGHKQVQQATQQTVADDSAPSILSKAGSSSGFSSFSVSAEQPLSHAVSDVINPSNLSSKPDESVFNLDEAIENLKALSGIEQAEPVSAGVSHKAEADTGSGLMNSGQKVKTIQPDTGQIGGKQDTSQVKGLSAHIPAPQHGLESVQWKQPVSILWRLAVVGAELGILVWLWLRLFHIFSDLLLLCV